MQISKKTIRFTPFKKMQRKKCYTVAPRRASEMPGSPSYERLKVGKRCEKNKYVEYFENLIDTYAKPFQTCVLIFLF